MLWFSYFVVQNKKLELAKTVSTTTKIKERDQRYRKSLILLAEFVSAVRTWQEERPPLSISNENLEFLIAMFLGEIAEVEEHRVLEGLPGYDPKSERNEIIDSWFFLSSLSALLELLKHERVDFNEVLYNANGQTNGTHALEKLREVAGNVELKSFQKDLEYLWTCSVSYLIHMKFPINPTQTLKEYTLPKNDGNYSRELLAGNQLFEKTLARKMNREENIQYFAHLRKCLRLIRDFIMKYVDPGIENTGLRPEHFRPYKLFIFSFVKLPGVGISSQQALVMLEEQLYKDYQIPKSETEKLDISRLVFLK